MGQEEHQQVDETALKKAKDDAVSVNIKILENFYSFLISFGLTQATARLVDEWKSEGRNLHLLGAVILYFSLLVTIVPFYQGMNRFLFTTHVVRPLERPGFRSSPMLLDIYAFLIMSCLLFAMGRFLSSPTEFFYLWTALLLIDILWSLIVWRVQKSARPIWVANNAIWLVAAWAYWGVVHATYLPSLVPGVPQLMLPYGFVLFEIARTVADYKINWPFYFPPEYRGF